MPGGTYFSEALGVSADGRFIVGQSVSASGFEAFYWSQEDGMIGLGDLPGSDFFSIANDVSADGGTVVGNGYIEGTQAAFVGDPVNGIYNLQELLLSEFDIDVTALGLSHLVDALASRTTGW